MLISKSIRLSKADVDALNFIIKHDPRIEKNFSEALYYCYMDAAEGKRKKWKDIANTRFEDNIEGAEHVLSEEYPVSKSFHVEAEHFEKVRTSINDELELSRPRISYITRLCITAAKLRILEGIKMQNIKPEKKTKDVEVDINRTDGVSLIRQIAELLESSTDIANEKILAIKRIVEG